MIPYLKTFSEKFKRISKRHGFKTAFKPGNKVRDLRKGCQIPLGDKRKDVTYVVPCQCDEKVYVGETSRKWEERKYEHGMKVRMTKNDIADGNIESAQKRMGMEDGGLAKHSTECNKEVDWEKSRVASIERDTREWKIRESIESL